MKEKYINLFVDKEYPSFIDKYLSTKTLRRIQFVGQFCGCDYTKLYDIPFFYSRFDHSLVVAHITWHFTHDKKATIAALLHDVGTPCFAHSIDYVFGDYLNQETSEKSIVDLIQQDEELVRMMEEDHISLTDLEDLSLYPILENKSPKLCADRLDGVLHTCFIWLHTHSFEEIKEVYDNIIVGKNEDGRLELAFRDVDVALKFVQMVSVYAKELQGNKDKFVMQYVSDAVKLAVQKGLITLEDLYTTQEEKLVSIFKQHIKSWEVFQNATELIGSSSEPDGYFISFDAKRRNVIPLVQVGSQMKRIDEVSEYAKGVYQSISEYHDCKYACLDELKVLD